MGVLALVVGAVLVLAAVPAPGQAADASIGGSTLTFAAGADEANDLTVSLAAGAYTLIDAVAPVTAGAGCAQVAPNAVSCPSAGITLLTLDGRDLDDRIAVGGGTVAATLSRAATRRTRSTAAPTWIDSPAAPGTTR
jgi:hypothetical protein